MRFWRGGFLFLAIAVVAVLASCADEQYPAELWAQQHPPATGAKTQAHGCFSAHAQALPQRLVVMSGGGTGGGNTVLVSDLFQTYFVPICGACHGPSVPKPGQGGFQIATAADFTGSMTAEVLAHITNSMCPSSLPAGDPNEPMPPCNSPAGQTYGSRLESDPVRQFAELVTAWLKAGKPAQFSPSGASASSPSPAPTGADGGAAAGSGYTMSAENGNGLTNIGTCIPSPDMVSFDSSRAIALDAKFARARSNPSSHDPIEVIGLPEHLSDTDLFTFDSAVLAQYGVLAYAPTYPLWSDNAGKLRHIRVPRGTSVHFDKATQRFTIPPNTRFYKTFMKQIVDTDGSYRYHKIETRIIVSRPDTNNPDGSAAAQNALFGTYKWNDNETDAVLVQTPLRNGEPFADTVLLYHTDEALAAEVLGTNPALPEDKLLFYGAARHYAIPSSQRCIQCHEGSPTQDFVLGFNPVQVNRRPKGVGGIIEDTGPDELTQLQRFIDAGIISGIDSPDDVLPLEKSQGTRLPRNDFELTAQGYVTGNCQHCHNPRGFPTLQSPQLEQVGFNFLPDGTAEGGGIFQWPLERYSPRIFRGLTGDEPIPYITPSLVDMPRSDPLSGLQAPDKFLQGSTTSVNSIVYGPWRSLIYRNVDAAFAYTDDLALFPHMPFNTPGYDPRAKQILSDWMVSIPAVRKHPELLEYAYQVDQNASNNLNGPVDKTPQPYVEVRPGDAAYAGAVAAAKTRLDVLHTDKNPALPPSLTQYYSRYQDPGVTDDIFDPAVLDDPVCHPIPVAPGGFSAYLFPNHPHWVPTDLTQVPGAWSPRQINWLDVLVTGTLKAQEGSGCAMSSTQQDAAFQDQLDAISMLPDASLDQVRGYAQTPHPFGLWQTANKNCDFSSQKTVSQYTGTERPQWMDATNAPPDAPVYTQTAGEAVFKMICINCHGPAADSNGRLAQNLATMTGGLARVADFRDGLFGPVSAPGANIESVYGNQALPPGVDAKWLDVPAEDRAARYMAWMGLGGTSVNIPLPVLQIVAISKVLDQHRSIQAATLSANMLSQAKSLCLGLLGPTDIGEKPVLRAAPGGHGYFEGSTTFLNSRLIYANYDAELWLHLCSLANPPPVHVIRYSDDDDLELRVASIANIQGQLTIDGASGTSVRNFVPASVYPAGVPIGNEAGGTDPTLWDDKSSGTLHARDPSVPWSTNVWPWCVDKSSAPTTDMGQTWLSTVSSYPACPKEVLDDINGLDPSASCPQDASGVTCFGDDAANKWAVRGAINAGFSVFLYVQWMETHGTPPDYDQCEKLK